MEYFEKADQIFRSGDHSLAACEYTKFINYLENKREVTILQQRTRERLSLAYNNRGQAEYLQVNFFEAISDFTYAIKHNPEYPVAFYNRGLIHYRLGQYTLAINDFKKALEFQPDFEDANKALSTALKEQQSFGGDRNWPGYCDRIKQ